MVLIYTANRKNLKMKCLKIKEIILVAAVLVHLGQNSCILPKGCKLHKTLKTIYTLVLVCDEMHSLLPNKTELEVLNKKKMRIFIKQPYVDGRNDISQ